MLLEVFSKYFSTFLGFFINTGKWAEEFLKFADTQMLQRTLITHRRAFASINLVSAGKLERIEPSHDNWANVRKLWLMARHGAFLLVFDTASTNNTHAS